MSVTPQRTAADLLDACDRWHSKSITFSEMFRYYYADDALYDDMVHEFRFPPLDTPMNAARLAKGVERAIYCISCLEACVMTIETIIADDEDVFALAMVAWMCARLQHGLRLRHRAPAATDAMGTIIYMRDYNIKVCTMRGLMGHELFTFDELPHPYPPFAAHKLREEFLERFKEWCADEKGETPSEKTILRRMNGDVIEDTWITKVLKYFNLI